MKYCCKICGRSNSAQNWLDGHLKCSNCGQLIKSVDNAICLGHFVAERYELKKLLEQRTNTNIYIAFDLFKQCPVLLRLYFWDFTYSVTSSDNFLKIAQSVSHLAQPEHLKIISCGKTQDGMIYTVWPYENLESVSRLLYLNGPFETGVALSICRDIVVCLDNVYQQTGLGHYNLNTNKIYLTAEGDVRLSDLGQSAYLINDENEYFNERFLGPEITLEEEKPNIHSDMFSLGACLYFMLTGKRPFENLEYVSTDDYDSFQLAKSHEFRLGDSTVRLLYRLLKTDPNKRYNNWLDVIKTINHCLNQLTEGNTNFRKTRLTTKFEDDFLFNFQEEKYEETEPKILNASDLVSTLKTQKPTRRVLVSKNTSYVSVKNICIAAILSFSFTFLYFSINEQKKQESENIHLSQQIVERSPNIKAKVKKSPQTKTKHKSTHKEFTSVEVNQQQLQSLSLKPKVNTPREEFQELKLLVREMALRKLWDDALDTIDAYSGPYAAESLSLKEEIERRRFAVNTPPPKVDKKRSLIEEFFATDTTLASSNRNSVKIHAQRTWLYRLAP